MNAPETKLILRSDLPERYLEEAVAEVRQATQTVSKASKSDWHH